MAVRVRLKMTAPSGSELVTTAVLNGGFEVERPHLLLPTRCARALLGDYTIDATRQPVETAAGAAEFLVAASAVQACATTPGRDGTIVRFAAYVADAETEVLVSDSGIDALGLRIESFAPGRWRFADEVGARVSEPPERW